MDKETLEDISVFLHQCKGHVNSLSKKKTRYYLTLMIDDNIREVHKKIRLLKHRRPEARDD